MSSPLPGIELHASRALRVALLGLAALAALAVALSDAPAVVFAGVPALLWAAWPSAPAWRAIALQTDGVIRLDAPAALAEAVRLQRRGPLTVLSLRADGRLHRLLFTTPGTLRADQRRVLGLWFDRHAPAARRAGGAAHV